MPSASFDKRPGSNSTKVPCIIACSAALPSTAVQMATLASVFYSIFLIVAAQGLVPGVPALGADRLPGEIASAFAIGPVSGVVFGAAAAWYRRFLYLTSPARAGARGGQGGNRRTTANRSGSRRR